MKDKFYLWLSYRLPKELIEWCAIRLMVNATTGKYSDQVVPELTAIEALNRWS